MELLGKYTLFAEGARGSLTKQLIAKFALDANSEPPKFGIGLKEVWQIDPAKHQKGLIQHSFGWPLERTTGGGSFLYHYDDNLVAVGFVVHLNYDDPYLSPFDEFQRFKTHPVDPHRFRRRQAARLWRARHHRGRLSVGAAAELSRRRADRLRGGLRQRAAHQGRAQCDGHAACWPPSMSPPRLAPAAPMTNSSTTKMPGATPRSARICIPVRNVKPLLSKFGTILGVALGGFDMWCNTLFGFSLFGTQSHAKPDRKTLDPAKPHAPIAYPKPDGKISFDKLSSVFLSNTNHEEDQPVHLKVADMNLQKTSEHDVFAGPSNRYCPAGVYEWVEEASGPALPDQRPELRPLQNLRREGPQRQHYLGSAGGRRRTQLRGDVTRAARLREPRPCANMRDPRDARSRENGRGPARSRYRHTGSVFGAPDRSAWPIWACCRSIRQPVSLRLKRQKRHCRRRP